MQLQSRITRWLVAGLAAVALVTGGAYVAAQPYRDFNVNDNTPDASSQAVRVSVSDGPNRTTQLTATGNALTSDSRPRLTGQVGPGSIGGVDLLILSTPVRTTRVQFRAEVSASGFFDVIVPIALAPGSYLLYANGKFVGTFTIR